jgi:hypothetical protein
MKRLILAPLGMALVMALIATAGAPAAFGDEMTEVYRQIYLESVSLQDKYNAAQNMIALDDKSVAPILAEAFAELLRTQNNYKDATERAVYGQTVRLLANALGQFKYTDSAAFLWDAVQQVADPLAQSESLIALGRMRALDYAERISIMLRNLNFKPTVDTDSGEKQAFGCIVALDKLKDPQGFSPVFLASDGWYSQRVKQQALRSLPNITPDPTEPVRELLTNEDPPRKIKAFQLEIASSAPEAKKKEIATLALVLGHLKSDANKPAEAKVFGDLRKLALRSLIALKATGTDAVDAELKSVMGGFDDEEKLLGFQALGVNGSDAAATAIDGVLRRLNDEVKNGVSDENKIRMGVAAVNAAGATKNAILRPALTMVASNNKWSNSVIYAAQTALKAFK